jgi:PAT family beta-lactamase induction signal transducer AmpG
MNRSPLLWVPSGYFAMAIGYIMLTSVTSIMFKNLGMDNGKAALYSSMLILAYTIKPLFAPVVEMYRTKKFFVLCMQVLRGAGDGHAGLDGPGDGTVLGDVLHRRHHGHCQRRRVCHFA